MLWVSTWWGGPACRLPREVREERCREWAAELPAILHDPQVRFAPRRAVRMLGYAADTLRGTAMTPGRTPGVIARSRQALPVPGHRPRGGCREHLGHRAGAGGWTWDLGLIASLLFAAYFICRLAHAPERMTTLILFSTAMAFQVDSVWAIARAPGDWVNYFLGSGAWAYPPGCPSVCPPGPVVPQTPGPREEDMMPPIAR